MLGLAKKTHKSNYKEILKELIYNPAYTEILLFIKDKQETTLEAIQEQFTIDEDVKNRIKFLLDYNMIVRDGNILKFSPSSDYENFDAFLRNFKHAKNVFYDNVKSDFEKKAFNTIILQEKLNETFENLNKYSHISSQFRTFYKKDELYKKSSAMVFEEIKADAFEIYEIQDNTPVNLFFKYSEESIYQQTPFEIKQIQSVIDLKEPAISNSPQKDSIQEKKIFAIFPVIEEGVLTNILFFGFDNRKLSLIKDHILELMDGFSLNFKLTLKTVKMIENLEQRVQERTNQLKQANSQLKEINNEIEKKNKSKIKEIEIGANIQQTVVPNPKQIPKIGPLSIGAVWVAMPMKITGKENTNIKPVAGDFFNFYKISDDEVGILIADASGHGIPAALLTMMASAAFSSNSRKGGTTADICTRANTEIHNAIGDIGYYLTAFYLKVNLKTLDVEYTNAGHHYAIVYRKETQTIEHWNSDGFFIGSFAEANYGYGNSKLNQGDKVVMYTDGFDESRNDKEEFFGEERIDEFLIKNHDLHPKDFAEKLYQEVLQFCNFAPGWDDRTLVVIDVGTMESNSPNVVMENILTYLDKEEFDKAEQEVLKYIEQFGENMDILMHLGEVYYLSDQMEKSEEIFMKAKNLDPKDPKPFQALSKIAYSLKQFEKSAEYSQEATKLMTMMRRKKK